MRGCSYICHAKRCLELAEKIILLAENEDMRDKMAKQAEQGSLVCRGALQCLISCKAIKMLLTSSRGFCPITW